LNQSDDKDIEILQKLTQQHDLFKQPICFNFIFKLKRVQQRDVVGFLFFAFFGIWLEKCKIFTTV